MRFDDFCLIAGAGESPLSDAVCGDFGFVIAADGGAGVLAKFGLLPQLFVGDLDSFDEKPIGCETHIHPTEKDDTDMALALSAGVSRGYRNFVVIGGLGGRLDHTVANLQTALSASRSGVRVIFLGERYNMTVITDRSLDFPPTACGYLSVFAMDGEAKGVTLRGVKYRLEDATLTPNRPLGVSNEFAREAAHISVAQGSLAVIWENADGKTVFPVL